MQFPDGTGPTDFVPATRGTPQFLSGNRPILVVGQTTQGRV